MWNNNDHSSYGRAPPAFPTFPGGAGGFGAPEPRPGYDPGYAPSYGPPPDPPSSYGAPPGPPPSGFSPPPGPPHSGYGPPPIPPRFGPPPGPPAGERGFPPPIPPRYGPPPGPPSSYAPPPGPPPGFPGQQYHQQHQQQSQGGYHRQQTQSGYPGQYSGPPLGGNAYHQGPPPRPPAQIQHYGPHFQGTNNRDAQLSFQYSQCTGKKKALCIGINYFAQDGELRGCINDANNIRAFLCTKFGYKREDIVMLTDDSTNPRMMPTRENILQAMQWLVRGASPNDALFFHYSGHGGQTKDLDGDEADGFDEVIYPMDFQANGHIVDDLMHQIMVKPLPAGCRLTAIFDSCHSGSALDLPYVYSTEGKIKEPNLAAEAGQGLLAAVTSYARGDMGGVFQSAMGLVKTASGNTQKAEKISKETRTSPADVISWSGCKDSQTSADTQEAGKATGAMSFAFISTLSENTQQSYQELLVNIREILRSKYSQKPQLSSSHPMDTNIMFIC